MPPTLREQEDALSFTLPVLPSVDGLSSGWYLSDTMREPCVPLNGNQGEGNH